MNSTRMTMRLLSAALALAGGGSADALEASKTPPPGLSYEMPGLGAGGTKISQLTADTLGWQMFTAFNWPAKAGERGVPDPGKTIGEPGPVVWETWKSPDEVFYPDGSRPPPWEVYGTQIPPECQALGARGDGSTATVLAMTSKVSDTLVDRTGQAVGGTLTDQNRNLVHYSIAFAKPVFNFIYDNGYYNIAGQNEMGAAVSYPVGAAEMKAAWRVLLPSEPEEVKRRFFRRESYVYTPAAGGAAAGCKLQEVGLVGMHFNLKVDYPGGGGQWFMATFEQVDNVPPFKTPYQPGKDEGHTLPYSLFNKACYASPCAYNQSTEQGRPLDAPTEAIRMVNIDPQAQQLNPQWQAKLRQAVAGSPWQYYQMVTTQYPANPSQKPNGDPSPRLSANTTMETYVRQSSCLNCHYTAKNVNAKYFADYSFMLAQACPKPLFGPPVVSDVCKPNAAAPKPQGNQP